MRTFLAVLVVVSACGGSKPAPKQQDDSIANASGSGSAAPAGAPTGPVPCQSVYSLQCDHETDGCTLGLTTHHACIAKPTGSVEKAVGPPCNQEIALQCVSQAGGDGMKPIKRVDACLHSPPLAANHICVRIEPFGTYYKM